MEERPSQRKKKEDFFPLLSHMEEKEWVSKALYVLCTALIIPFMTAWCTVHCTLLPTYLCRLVCCRIPEGRRTEQSFFFRCPKGCFHIYIPVCIFLFEKCQPKNLNFCVKLLPYCQLLKFLNHAEIANQKQQTKQ